ncbi:sensor histidine kinase, partial [Nonomuraea sp. SBT364]|uniref:sensor histidine kinase n=1 Tax=Nonomuraea sp. SBT364 TaxID=1580530 RepID=UPI00069F7E53
MTTDHARPIGSRPYGPPSGTGFLAFALIGAAAAWDTAAGDSRPAWLAWLGLAAVTALYAAAVLLAFRSRPVAATVALALLAAAVTALAAVFAGGWLYLFPLAGIACGLVLAGRTVRAALLAPLLAVTAAAALVTWLTGGGLEPVMALAWGTFSAGLVVAFIMHLHALIAELAGTRRRLADAAVERERLRFARDLHDLLGHTLSVVVVKAEAVRRLARRDPGQAERHAADIETVGRQALAEVREAVTGYREGSLGAELARAGDALSAAGVSASVRRTGEPPHARAQELLGWVVREGVTNVLRHSGATRVTIHLTGHSVTIHDDGPAPAGAVAPPGPGDASDPGDPPISGGGAGTGLRGLSERLAQAGGTVEAGPAPEGGW